MKLDVDYSHTCKNCKHLKKVATEISPGGQITMDTYRCQNVLSYFYNYQTVVLNLKNETHKTIDSRKDNTCLKFSMKLIKI